MGRWNGGPDGCDISRGRKEEEQIMEHHARCAAEMREMGVYVPERYTDALICQLIREHNPPSSAEIKRRS